MTLERPALVFAYTAPTRATPRDARYHGHAWLIALGAPEAHIELVDLLVSELVTNAVVHGAGPVEIRLGANGVGYEIEVRDHGARAVPKAPAPARPDDECHRGWELVEGLTGRPPLVVHDASGTRVSATLAYSALEEAA